jgi:hypothetical protein
MHQMWQNERHAEDQMQLDELEEQQCISIADCNLQQRMMRLDQLANNMSSTQVDVYGAQLAAQKEQVQTDREIAAALAAEYEEQRNNDLALRMEMEEEESDQGESDAFGRISSPLHDGFESDSSLEFPSSPMGSQHDAFGRISPLQFPSSPSPTPMHSPSQHIPSLSSSPVQSPLLHVPSLPPVPPIPPVPPAPIRPLPSGRVPYQDPPQRHSLGPMNVQCLHCQALHFDCEKLAKSTRAIPKFGSCCLQGQIRLPPFCPAPAAFEICYVAKVHWQRNSKLIFNNIMLHLHSHLWVSRSIMLLHMH